MKGIKCGGILGSCIKYQRFDKFDRGDFIVNKERYVMRLFMELFDGC